MIAWQCNSCLPGGHIEAGPHGCHEKNMAGEAGFGGLGVNHLETNEEV